MGVSPREVPRVAATLIATVLMVGAGAAASDIEIWVKAPSALASVAARIRQIDRSSLLDALVRAGLDVPPAVTITLIPEDDEQARQTPPWVVGRAFFERDVVIFPERVTAYPYNSLESVVRHEIVHLALGARARGRPLPRWFHEGLAVSVEAGWGLGDSMRLAFAALEAPAIADLRRLFESDRQPETARAYLLAAALVGDLRERHGQASPGAIARRVGEGVTFDRAFALETGETPDQAAVHAWRGYRRWSRWLPLVTQPSTVWGLTLVLAFLAFFARAYQRVKQRRLWEEEEERDKDAEPKMPSISP